MGLVVPRRGGVAGAREPVSVIQRPWREASRVLARGSGLGDSGWYFTPRLKLSDLEENAPWFYDHIPSYVLEREDWFDLWHMDSMAVYINHRGSHTDTPRMIEFCGRFAIEGRAKEKRFDTFFDPGVFRRTHIHGKRQLNALNLARPCRESDVFVLSAPGDSFRIRFMVPAPKLNAARRRRTCRRCVPRRRQFGPPAGGEDRRAEGRSDVGRTQFEQGNHPKTPQGGP